MAYIMGEYDKALAYILENGDEQENRTGVKTLTIFGMQSRYRIDEKFPIITGRKVWPSSIFAELLWFISGSTNNEDLQALNANIWTPWVDEDFEKRHGYEPGALGPIYGFQLRHFGGSYGKGKDVYIASEKLEYGLGGFDQLNYMVNLLKEDPNSRRNLFDLWNPKDLKKQRLACCHFVFQVYVNNGKLSGMLTQRSADMAIGACSNIQFYSALLHMLGQQTGYEPYELIHSIGNAHIYEPHIEGLKRYLDRKKPDSPTLKLKKAKDIYSYSLDDFVIEDYNPLKPIKFPVMV